jgi:hypothetical protein
MYSGNGERDDDLNDNYGGIIYIYNDKEVRVMAPKRANSQNMVKYGVAIYTGNIFDIKNRCQGIAYKIFVVPIHLSDTYNSRTE